MELKRYRKVNRIKQFNVHADKLEFVSLLYLP